MNNDDAADVVEFFPYGEAEIAYLQRRDKKLGAAMDRIGRIEREVFPDLFSALVRSVAAQQISAKAARTVFGRLRETLGRITPEAVVNAKAEDIQKCGFSARKAGYIKGIGAAVHSGAVDLAAFPAMPDEALLATLSSLPGVGVWTAEMLLIFSLKRPNVLSWGDLAIRRGMTRLYGLKELTRDHFERRRKCYAPYGSVASLYLWAISAQ